MPRQINTSWENVAEWYSKLLEGDGTYQKELVLPNLLRLMNIQHGDKVLDLACGPGFFSREFAAKGAVVVGVDASRSLPSHGGMPHRAKRSSVPHPPMRCRSLRM